MITPTIVKVLYLFVIAGAGLVALGMVLSGITAARLGSSISGVFILLLAPVAFIVIVTYGRVLLEVVITFFRMGENVAKITERALE